MPTILHEQTGLRISKNDKNGFVVCRLHFTADSRKRGEEWKAASKRGMNPAQWEQEFNISYEAKLGEKAFPEIRERSAEIILAACPYFEGWPSHLTMFGGFDYGARSPSSFHIYTIVDGITYAIWELYEPCKNIISFAEKMKACPYWDQVRYIVHDPDMSSLRQRDLRTGDVTSVRAQFESLGIHKWVAGNTDEQGWLAKMQKHWCGPDITFKIMRCCPNMIDEFEQATFKGLSDRQLQLSDPVEGLIDKHNHAMDDCKYFMNGVARPVNRKLKIPGMGEMLGYGVSSTWADSATTTAPSGDSPQRRWGLV